jgi:leader peptidase (prepilin peptidase)/N-methyltransferase
VDVEPSLIAVLAMTGAAVGSFLNVVAQRLPRGESIVRPRSRCPMCGVAIASYDNVPVISWIALGGRCRSCTAPISARYPIVEAVTALLFVAVALRAERLSEVWPGLALVTTLVAVAAIDIEHRIVPNRLLAPSAAAALALWALGDPGRLPENLVFAAAASVPLLIAAVAYPAGMGMGDVKLAMMLGAMLGRTTPVGMLVGMFAALVPSVVLLVRHGSAARKMGLPFAPYLAFGSIVALFAGKPLLHGYLTAFHK